MKYYNLDPLPIVSGDPAELFFDDREDCEFARTLAARTAAIISQVRRYTVTRYACPGRQIIVSPSTRTPGGWQVTFYHTDRITGDMDRGNDILEALSTIRCALYSFIVHNAADYNNAEWII